MRLVLEQRAAAALGDLGICEANHVGARPGTDQRFTGRSFLCSGHFGAGRAAGLVVAFVVASDQLLGFARVHRRVLARIIRAEIRIGADRDAIRGAVRIGAGLPCLRSTNRGAILI